jgi:hypothetical protein
MEAADRQHVLRISRDRYYIGRGEQNPLAEDMHHEVNYLGQELCSGTHIPASSRRCQTTAISSCSISSSTAGGVHVPSPHAIARS